MNCCITLVIALTLTSIISASQCFFFWGWSLMGKDIPGWLCVAHVFGHVHAQIPEKHRAKPCFALQNKNTACQFGYKGGKVEAGVVRGFASCQRCQSPSRQIVRVSWGVEREALLWFWSTDQCQAWSIGVVLWREDGGDGGGGGWKDWGTWNINDVDFLPQLSPGRPRCLRPVRNSEDGADGGRGVWFQALGLLFGSLGAHDFRVMGSRLRRGPAASLLAMIPPPDAHTAPTHTPSAP